MLFARLRFRIIKFANPLSTIYILDTNVGRESVMLPELEGRSSEGVCESGGWSDQRKRERQFKTGRKDT